jgi:FlaA1/EpsC-like NDP-sugar epimerase
MSRFSTLIYESLKNAIVQHRRIVVTLIFLFHAVVANYLAFLIRFDASIKSNYLGLCLQYLPILLCFRLVFFLQGGLYKGLWRYASITDLVKIIKSSTLGSCMFFLVVRYGFNDAAYPLSIYVLDWLLLILISGGSRLLMRVFREYMSLEPTRKGFW